MPPRSRVRDLPHEMQVLVAKLLADGLTLDQMLDHLHQLGMQQGAVSRSGLGRHTQRLRDAARRKEKAEAFAEVWTRTVKDSTDSSILRAAVEIAGAMATDALMALDGETVDPKNFMMLTRALESLGKAKNLDISAALKAEESQLKAAEAAIDGGASGAGGATLLQIEFVESPNVGEANPLGQNEKSDGMTN